MLDKTKKLNSGFAALIFVIMITSLFIVSSVIIAMVNTSNNMANYHVAESDDVMYNIDACLSDAMWQIASSTSASGDYSINNVGGITCAYQISATASGLKTVTSTATTTSAVGSWNRSVVMRVNVSSSPFFIQSHKDYLAGTCLNNSCCFDGVCNAGETCSTCSADCGACPVCGNGTLEGSEVCDDGNLTTESCGDRTTQSGGPYCNSTCTVAYAGGEACDDGNTATEACGDGVIQSGGAVYCNNTCSVAISRSETCEFALPDYYCSDLDAWCGDCMDEDVSCPGKEVIQMYNCHDCATNKEPCTDCP